MFWLFCVYFDPSNLQFVVVVKDFISQTFDIKNGLVSEYTRKVSFLQDISRHVPGLAGVCKSDFLSMINIKIISRMTENTFTH